LKPLWRAKDYNEEEYKNFNGNICSILSSDHGLSKLLEEKFITKGEDVHEETDFEWIKR